MNEFTTAKVLANYVEARLEKELFFPLIVDGQYQDQFINKQANGKISIPIYTDFEAMEFIDEIHIQEIKEGEMFMELNAYFDVSYEITAKERVLNTPQNKSAFKKKYLDRAYKALYKKMEQICADQSFVVPNYVEDLAGAPTSFADIINIRKALKNAGVAEGEMLCVLDLETSSAMLGGIEQINKADVAGSAAGVQKAAIGEKGGVNFFESYYLNQFHEAAPTIPDGATVAVEAVAGEKVALSLAGLNGDEEFKRGNIITFTNGSRAAIAEDQTATGATMTLNVVNLLNTVPATTEFDVIAMGNSLAMGPDAIAFVSVPLEVEGDNGTVSQSEKFPQLAIRSTYGYDQKKKKTTFSVDFLAGVKVVHLDRIFRVNGKAVPVPA